MVDPSNPSTCRVLVVEDDVDIRDHVAELLRIEGYEVVVADDGEQALSILRARAAFDLIVLDLMLPRMDGWQFRLAQRAQPLLAAIPVIALSTSTSAKARAIDADAYLPKPFSPEALLSVVRQVIEQRRMWHLDRLASIGRLAAGMSHEVNNPLTYIYASLSMAQNAIGACKTEGAANGGEVRVASDKLAAIESSLERALEGVDRVRAIMGGIRLFIRAPDEGRGPVDLRAPIESALGVLSHEIEQKARLEKSLAEIPILVGNPGQLGQLFVHLFSNALDAIPEGEPARHCLTVRTATTARGEVMVEVADTGVGMSETVRARIFEPFFTTKVPGMATGLGLAICHGIVRSHGGSIDVDSKEGRGTRIRIVLPAVRTVIDTGRSRPPPRKPRVLILDDDPLVAEALGRLLALDHEPTVMTDPVAALERIEHENPPPDAILCDFFLGELTGADVYDRVRQTRPELLERIVFMTGAAFTESGRRFLESVPNPCLDKPFSAGEFKRTLQQLSKPLGTSRTRMRAARLDEPIEVVALPGARSSQKT